MPESRFWRKQLNCASPKGGGLCLLHGNQNAGILLFPVILTHGFSKAACLFMRRKTRRGNAQNPKFVYFLIYCGNPPPCSHKHSQSGRSPHAPPLARTKKIGAGIQPPAPLKYTEIKPIPLPYIGMRRNNGLAIMPQFRYNISLCAAGSKPVSCGVFLNLSHTLPGKASTPFLAAHLCFS